MSDKPRLPKQAKAASPRAADAIPKTGKPQGEQPPARRPEPAPRDMGDWIIGKRH